MRHGQDTSSASITSYQPIIVGMSPRDAVDGFPDRARRPRYARRHTRAPSLRAPQSRPPDTRTQFAAHRPVKAAESDHGNAR